MWNALDEERMVGAIFKGKVQNLEPGLKAAFVNIGQEKNAFLTLLGYASRCQ